jgi:hypothetical protein
MSLKVASKLAQLSGSRSGSGSLPGSAGRPERPVASAAIAPTRSRWSSRKPTEEITRSRGFWTAPGPAVIPRCPVIVKKLAAEFIETFWLGTSATSGS